MKMPILGALVMLGFLAGCDGVIGADGQAEVEVLMAGGEERADGLAQFAEEPEAGSMEGTATGDVEVRARVLLRSEAGEWVEVTRGSVEKHVSIEGEGSAVTFTRGSVRPGQYDRVRVEFEKVTANLDGELRLAFGILSGSIDVRGASGEKIVVERQTSMDATSEARSRLKVFLNAEQWLRQADSESRMVHESEFRSAVRITQE